MSKIKAVILGIAIAIVLAFFFGYGINTFYNPPRQSDFCEDEFVPRPLPIKELNNCSEIEDDEELRNECNDKDGRLTLKFDDEGCVEEYFCETCYGEFDKAREKYNRDVFIISTILGIISITIGAFLKLTSVSAGIMSGGVITIIYGTIRYWGNLPDLGRFLILGVALAILIWIGYKKFKK